MLGIFLHGKKDGTIQAVLFEIGVECYGVDVLLLDEIVPILEISSIAS